jgi:hypothetical protein
MLILSLVSLLPAINYHRVVVIGEKCIADVRIDENIASVVDSAQQLIVMTT